MAVLSSAGCVLLRPHHTKALVIDAVGMFVAAGLMGGMDSSRHVEADGPVAADFGEPLLKITAGAALATLVLYVVDREIEIEIAKRAKKERAEKEAAKKERALGAPAPLATLKMR